jgi:hypothetical protein
VRKILISGAVAIAATVGLAAPAFAIDPTDCRSSDQLKISYYPWGQPHDQCFVNAGSINTTLPGAVNISPGNNDGDVEFVDVDGTKRWTPFSRWQSKPLNGVKITKVTIYAR